ncbi:MAG: hypothetical protein LUG93_04840 [Lachnospiraceae bacterium]|nr:hypothetical protein [Lachnospiraceae bacterium]
MFTRLSETTSDASAAVCFRIEMRKSMSLPEIRQAAETYPSRVCFSIEMRDL